MPSDRITLRSLEFRPLTPGRWKDFEQLFGKRGAVGGCWCMWWRISRSQFEKQKGEGNRRAMKRIVMSRQVPGILAYENRQPIAWCSVGPRESFPVLGRSRVLKPVDDKPVWSIVCFYIPARYRRQGLSGKLIRAAIQYVRSQGGRMIEAYPVEPKKGQTADVYAWTGLASTFRKMKFKEVARRSPTRPIMRKAIRPS
jgi:GNAT superfamily N-acetyltransferase